MNKFKTCTSCKYYDEIFFHDENQTENECTVLGLYCFFTRTDCIHFKHKNSQDKKIKGFVDPLTFIQARKNLKERYNIKKFGYCCPY